MYAVKSLFIYLCMCVCVAFYSFLSIIAGSEDSESFVLHHKKVIKITKKPQGHNIKKIK